MLIIAETPALLIRTLLPGDEEPYVAMLADPEVNRHLPRRTPEQNRELFKAAYINTGAALNRWAIVHRSDNAFAGMCLLRHFADNDIETIEIGYSFCPPYWGKGYATEAVKALTAYGLALPQTRQIVAVTTPGNTASQRVLLKAGFKNNAFIERDSEKLAFFKLVKPADYIAPRPGADLFSN